MLLTEDYFNSLSKDVYKNTNICLQHFSMLQLDVDATYWNTYNSANPLFFHVYWYGKITRKQLLCIKSYLATQNLNKTKLIVWLDYKNGYNENNINIIPKHINIIIKKFIPDKLAKGTLFEGKHYINLEDINLIKYRSDLARVLFLYHYGGLYYDLDLILIKDLAPFLHLEFCYQWSNIIGRGNNALLSLHKGSNICINLFNKYIKYIEIEKKQFGLDYNRVIFDYELNLLQLPSSIFDPVWILLDGKTKSNYSKLNNFDNFFKETNEKITKITDFFQNKVFAYHWHSRYSYKIEDNSYFNKLERIIDNILYNKYNK